MSYANKRGRAIGNPPICPSWNSGLYPVHAGSEGPLQRLPSVWSLSPVFKQGHSSNWIIAILQSKVYRRWEKYQQAEPHPTACPHAVGPPDGAAPRRRKQK